MAIAVFVLILYSTFLTRSGILGDASVHSFTDLGLSGQLLIYLLFFTVAAIALAAWHWKHIPSSEKETEVYSREFWIFLGATILCFSGFHVIIPTSYPVINEMGSWFGLDLRLAVPGNQVEYYSRYQIWFGVLVALASGTAQFFWWRKIDKHNLVKELLYPVLISLVVFALIISLAKIYKPAYLVLTLAGVYLIVSNLKVLFTVSKVKKSLSGGAISHLGVGLMLIGIMFSAGYSSVVSLNNTGMLISKDLPTEFNRDNLLLFINETRVMAGYEIEYLGERVKPNGIRGYVSKNDIDLTFDPYQVIATKDIYYNNKKILNARDTFEINPENTFYEVELRKNGKVEAVLFPRVQINPAMGGFVASPDIERHVGRDLYTHVSLPMNREEEPEWSEMSEERIRINQEFFVNDYVAVLEEVVRIHEIDGYILDETDVAVKAKIKVKGERDEYFAEPIFLIREKSQVGRIASEINDLGVKITLLNIHPDTNDFSLGINTRQKDWVIIKAIEMPLINVLWLGTGVLMVGFTVAMVRRFKDFRKEV